MSDMLANRTVEEQKPVGSSLAPRRILYVQYTNPAGYPPLEHSSRLLADAGCDVLFLGTGALGAGALRFPPHPRITVRQLPFCPAGWQQKLHYLRYCLWVLAWALRWRPHWVYASDVLACPVALLLSFWPGIRVLYHEHDSPASGAARGLTRVCLAARRALARRADWCILPNEQRLARFRHGTGTTAKTACVWNCPTLDEVIPEREPRSGDLLTVLYHGSIVPSRLPLTVIEALALLPDSVRLRIVGYQTVGHIGYVQTLRETAACLGIVDRLEILHAVPRRKLLEIAATCDVGLALLPLDPCDPNLRAMTGASNKAFDYLACGLAVLVSNRPEWRSLYVEAGYGLCCDPNDATSIAEALSYYLHHLVELRRMASRGRFRVTQDWNYETQFAPVLCQLAPGFDSPHRLKEPSTAWHTESVRDLLGATDEHLGVR